MVRKCVIPLGGLGTRFLPITKAVSKTMLTIIDRPVIHYLVKEALDSGIEEVLLIINEKDDEIIEYFKKNEFLKSKDKNNYLEETDYIIDNIKISFGYEDEPKGSAHAIYLAKDFVGKEPFALMFGDDLFDLEDPILKKLINKHNKTASNVIGVRPVLMENISSYGCIKKQEDRVLAIIEKPKIEEAPSNLAVVGRYVLNHTIFNEIENLEPGVNNEYQITDAIKKLITKEKMYAIEIESTYYDIGSKLGYIKANIAFALKREDLKKDVKDFIKTYE
jgi:UTP--glucose-1-phosphate uridylyltransferase